MNVMIVEDERITALFLKKTLENLGHKVLDIHDRAETLFHAIQKHDPDLVLMDVEIKGNIDGVGVARALYLQHDIPSIFVTSYKDSVTMQDAMDAKPLGYIIKPVLEKDIEAALRVAQCRIQPECLEHRGFTIGPYTLIEKLSTVKQGDEIIHLSKKMLPVIVTLFKNYGTIVSTEYLVSAIQHEYPSFQEHQLRDLIYRLRQKLPGIHIVSYSKIGYSIQLNP